MRCNDSVLQFVKLNLADCRQCSYSLLLACQDGITDMIARHSKVPENKHKIHNGIGNGKTIWTSFAYMDL